MNNPNPLPPWFRWMPGMGASQRGGPCVQVVRMGNGALMGTHDGRLIALSECRPDLTDPATLGCLVQLLREVSGDVGAHVEPTDRGWAAWYGSSDSPVYGRLYGRTDAPTEGGALWGALDAAWALRGGQ